MDEPLMVSHRGPRKRDISAGREAPHCCAVDVKADYARPRRHHILRLYVACSRSVCHIFVLISTMVCL